MDIACKQIFYCMHTLNQLHTHEGQVIPSYHTLVRGTIPDSSWMLYYYFGVLHCSAISVELYYIFATLWGREQYTLYGILFIVFVILLNVTACISIALTYFQLSSEDYRWWWRSLMCGGSTSIFVFGYAMFYYYKRSNMSGMLQSVQFLDTHCWHAICSSWCSAQWLSMPP